MPANILALALLAAVFAGIVYVGLGMPTPNNAADDPEPRCHSCHICGRIANTTVRRRDTGRREWACIGCRDQGTAWNWWADDLTDRNAS